jgi:hypothetical protein
MNLPDALLRSADYQALTDPVRTNFVCRLDYCEEAADKALDAGHLAGASLFEVVDDIELDALSMLSAGTPEAKVSPYVVHSSWTFECNRKEMRSIIVGDFKSFMSRPAAMFAHTESDVRAWLLEWGAVTRSMLERFEAAGTYTEAVARLIALDALLESVLVFAASVRLSDSIRVADSGEGGDGRPHFTH